MNEGGHDGRAIANFVLDYCEEAKLNSITPLSLQKLVYFCHVWVLIKTGRPLVRHSFEAWEFGPVLPYLYREFKDFQDQAITRRALALDAKTGARNVASVKLDCDVELLLQEVLNFYGRLSAGHLVELTHVSEGPWDVVWNHGGRLNPGMKIENEAICRYYSRPSSHIQIQ